jgi:hypothetical protein
MSRVQRTFNIKRQARALQGFSLKPDEPRLVINRMLFDTTALLNKSPEDIEAAYQRNPLILLGLMEISNFASLFGGETDWAKFFQLFRQNPPVTTFVHFLTPEPELEEYDCPGLLITQAEEPAQVIPFVQNVLRYAHNFYLWDERDLFSLVSLMRSRLLAAVVVNEAPDEFDHNLLRSLHHLNIPIFSRVPLGPMFNYNQINDLDDLFAKIHRLRPTFNARRIKRGEVDAAALAGPTERFEIGGGYSSFSVVRAMGGIDGVEVRGKMESEAGLIIDLGDSDVDITLTAYLENELYRIFQRHPWVRMESGEFFKLVLLGKMREPEEVGWEIYRRLKEKFSLTQVSVKLIFDSLRLQTLKAGIAAYKEERRQALSKRGDFDAPLFACTFCQRCSHNGFCIISVLHPPQCELTYDAIRARALFTGSLEHFSIKRGELTDNKKMLYSGVSKFARILSDGVVSKVNLQSLLDSPPPVTPYAQNLAYYNEQLEGIVILSCDYDGHSPDHRTFFGLLREVAGRQVLGVMGVSDDYILSRDFLAAEGGLKRLVWMPSLLKERLGLQKFTFIATERECNNIMSLRAFLRDRGFRS